MKLTAALLSLVGLALFIPSNAQATIFHFKATALFPVQQELPDPKNPSATIVKKVSLGTKEIINLAMGHSPDAKVDADIVLAVAVDHNDPDHAKLVVYNKHTLTELADVLTLLDPVDYNAGSKDGEKGAGNGLSRGVIHASGNTTNGIVSTNICGAATGSKTPGEHGPSIKISVTSIVGPMQAYLDSVFLDGLIIKGMFSSGGKPLDPL